MSDFVVRHWLAGKLGCEADQLDLVGIARATAKGREGRYDLDGGSMAVVLITWGAPVFGSKARRMVVATLPEGGALDDIDAAARIVW